jgi:hypothetical protein
MGRLLLVGLLGAVVAPQGAFAATPLAVDEARVDTAQAGVATGLSLTVSGGTPPFVVRLHVAPAGGTWEVVEGAPLPGPVVGVALPPTARERPFQWYATVQDGAGAQVAVGDALAPHTHATAEPPLPDAPPGLPPAAVDNNPPEDTAAPQPAGGQDVAPHPPVVGGRRQRADPSRGNDAPQGRAPRRKVRTERVVEVCGVPVWGAGRNPLLLIGGAVSLLTGLVTAAVGLLFALDLSLAQRMVLTVDRAQRRGDALPARCSSYADCRAPYLRAFWMDLAGVLVSVALTLGLGATAVGFLVAAVVFRRE